MTTTNVHLLRDSGLGNTSYLVDLGDGRALAVDASRDLRGVYGTAERLGLSIAYAADTHLHADFVSGSLDLARRDGATLFASASGNRAFPHTGLGDGDEVDLGGLRLRALATPGHTDEHLAFEVLDGQRTVGIFTGGSLIVGAAARTDLMDPDRAEEFARAQYRSLQRLTAFPDDVAIWPTHGGGSFCSMQSQSAPTTTVGAERAGNPLLAAPDEDAFVRTLLDALGSYPAYFRRLGELNRRGPAGFGAPGMPALAADEVRAAQVSGAVVVDVRPVRDFSAGHIPGSVSIPLRPVFASWLGWLVDFDADLVIVRNPDQDPDEVWWQAHKIGYDRLRGQVPDGLADWRAQQLPITAIPVIDADQVADRNVLDIRQDNEFASGHLPRARHIELGALAAAVRSDDPSVRVLAEPRQPTVVMCGHGERAMGAASLLARAGHHHLAVLDGGPDTWAAATGNALATQASDNDRALGPGHGGGS